MARHSMAQSDGWHDMAQHGIGRQLARYGRVWHRQIWHDVAWHSMAWHGKGAAMTWHKVAQHGTEWHGINREWAWHVIEQPGNRQNMAQHGIASGADMPWQGMAQSGTVKELA